MTRAVGIRKRRDRLPFDQRIFATKSVEYVINPLKQNSLMSWPQNATENGRLIR